MNDLMAACVDRVFRDAEIGRANADRLEWAMGMVKLRCGREVDSASEDWRHECEARFVAQMPSVAARRDYLDAVEKKRGKAAADELRASVAVEWKARKAA